MKLEVAFNGLDNQGIEFESKKISNKCVSMAIFDPNQSNDKNMLISQNGGLSTNDVRYDDNKINNDRMDNFESDAVQKDQNQTYRNTFKFWLKRRSSGFHVCCVEKTKVENSSQTSSPDKLPRPKEQIIEDEIFIDLNNNDVESSFYNLDDAFPDSLLSDEEYSDSLVSVEESGHQGYPEHIGYPDFRRRFDILLAKEDRLAEPVLDEKKVVSDMVKKLEIDERKYKLGLSQVFY
uniref:Uncharacterized protein n=1 Tax=Clytia hemisphaerica TaxID=252671 RepID=A0A7M5U5K5_9CNID